MKDRRRQRRGEPPAMMFAVAVLLVSAVQGVQADTARTSDVFPAFRLSINGSSEFAESSPAENVLHCSALCLATGDCVAANFDDGVCQMSPAGHVTLEESNTTTAILAEFESYNKFPGKQASVNGSSSFTEARSAVSVAHCTVLCEAHADCAVANYDKDAGVCHMSRDGQMRLEDNAHVTAIFGPMEDLPHVVGWWPLQEAYGGRDVSGHGNHMELHDVIFPADSISPWPSPAARFNYKSSSYGLIKNGLHLDVTSFSFVARVYVPFASHPITYLFSWQGVDEVGTRTAIRDRRLGARIEFNDGCADHYLRAETSVSQNTWQTVAVTYDFPNHNLTLWTNGVQESTTHATCGTNIRSSTELLIGKHSMSVAAEVVDWRMSCMILYNVVEDYNVMAAATMRHCGD